MKTSSRAKSSLVVLSQVDKVMERVTRCPWFVLTINATRYFMKKHFGKNEYALLLTDLVSVFTDWRDALQLSSMHESFNPQLSFDSPESSMKLLATRLEPHSQHLFSAEADGAVGLLLELKFAVSVVASFRWTFQCTTVAPAQAATIIRSALIEPLLSTSAELARQFVFSSSCVFFRLTLTKVRSSVSSSCGERCGACGTCCKRTQI
jgi:hypothetical protein